MRIFLSIISFIACLQYMHGQSITELKYYVINADNSIDTMRVVTKSIQNQDFEPLVLLFTEDDLKDMEAERSLRRKCFKRYGDVCIASWSYDNVINMSDSFYFPELFVKIIRPGESFDLVIISKNTPAEIIKDFLSSHLLVCTEKQIEKYINNFIYSLELHNVACKYDTLTVNWDSLLQMLPKQP